MKYLIVFIFLILTGSVSAQTYPCPVNGNAESNSFSNWTTYTSTAQDPQNLNAFSPGFDSGRFGVHDATTTIPPMLDSGVDGYGDFPIPSEGTYCFRVGNDGVGAQAEAMRYTFTVTPQNKIFKLRYALVLQDGGHPSGKNPAAWFYFVKGATVTPSFEDFAVFGNTMRSFVADLSNPFYKQSATISSVVYRPWECIEFDLSEYVGQTLSFVAIVRDCVEGGHFGYMYLDGLCTEWPAIAAGSLNKTEMCPQETLILNGSASEGEDSYFVEVAEMDPNDMYSYAPGGMVTSDWFVAQEAPSNFNVSSYIASKGKQFECGKKYKVKLAVANQCATWNETNFWVDIVCPEVDLGPDVNQCCVGDGVAQDYGIGVSPPVPGNTYSWTSIPAGFTSNSSSVSVIPTQNTAYVLEVTDPGGCKGTDTIAFRFLPNTITINLTSEYKLCDKQPYVTASISVPHCIPDPAFEALIGLVDYSDIQWHFQPTGGTSTFIGSGKTIHAPNADGILTASYNNLACEFTGSTSSQSMQLYYRPGGHGLIAPNTFTPDGGTYNNVFRILEFGPDAPENVGEGPAYDIVDFRLRLWDRWGENYKTISKADAGRLPHENVMQGDIFWDGTYNGLGVQDGVYNYTLEMQYCGTDHFERVCLDGSEVNACVQWFLGLFCIKRLSGCISHVTVLR